MARILVVDDEASLRKLYKCELEDEGYEVRTAANGVEALELLRDWKPALLILDIGLEGENGLESLRQILANHPFFPVILNTGYAFHRDDFRSWLADLYLLKTSDTQSLQEGIRELLARSAHGNRAPTSATCEACPPSSGGERGSQCEGRNLPCFHDPLRATSSLARLDPGNATRIRRAGL